MSRTHAAACAMVLAALAPAWTSAQRPSVRELHPIVRVALADGRAQLVGRAIDAGGGRWVVLATRERPGSQFDLFALVLERRSGRVVEHGRVELPTTRLWASTNGQPLPQPRVFASRLGDWDDDEERELELVVAYNTDEPCSAAIAYRDYYVLDVDDVRVAARITTREQVLDDDELVFLSGTVLHEDADGDGHRDLVFRFRRCGSSPDPRDDGPLLVCGDTSRQVYRWRASSDAWTEVPASVPSEPCAGESR